LVDTAAHVQVLQINWISILWRHNERNNVDNHITFTIAECIDSKTADK
jgi:hypothetical protein